ncbi:MAG: hypothetical protein HOE90_05315 [Bacteriovoracaceae bacterium]|jgi:hypothetical protein|nr:hypothetical protein [Bacteriovoracaceae bacterium]
MTLEFEPIEKSDQLEDLYDFNDQVFSAFADIVWTVDGLQEQMDENWELISVMHNNEIVAAVFLKEDDGRLLSKHTPIKLAFQGNGFSHLIKEFIEKSAKERSLTSVVNFCRVDNFRNVGLNETHGYIKLASFDLDDGARLGEWEKTLK